jgi:Fe2+ or Zn2+ uptake regulation protein
MSPDTGHAHAHHADTGQEWALHAREVLQRSGHHRGAARDKLIDLLSTQDCALSAQLVPFDDAGLERSISQLSRRLGFVTKEHEVTLRGNCAECR